MKERKSFRGTNSELTEVFNSCFNKDITAKGLKQMMNRWRYSLEEKGVTYESKRSNGQRLVEMKYYIPPSDGNFTTEETCAPVGQFEAG